MLDQLAAAAGSSEIQQVLSIAVAAIDPDPDQPRKTFEGLDGLAASIQAIGIKQPLLVRHHPDQPGHYVLVAGERRFRAAQRAGLEVVPCLIETSGTKEPAQLLLIQLIENLQRQDVSILETALALQQALEVSRLSKQALAKALGKRPSFVSKHLALLKAEGPARDALEEGLILSTETFRLFAVLPVPRQRSLLGQARKARQPIARGQVDKTHPETRKEGVEGGWAKTEAGEPCFSLKLSADQLRTLIGRFDVEPPTDRSQLRTTLLDLLRDSRSS